MNANARRAIKIVTLTTAAVGVVGLAYLLTWNRPAIMAKLSGRAPECPWNRVVRAYFDGRGFSDARRVSTTGVSVAGADSRGQPGLPDEVRTL